MNGNASAASLDSSLYSYKFTAEGTGRKNKSSRISNISKIYNKLHRNVCTHFSICGQHC